VECVRELDSLADAPEGAVIIEGWTGMPPAPAHYAELRFDGAALYWHDPRTLEEKANQVRADRDAQLLASDWVVTRSMERGEPVPVTWTSYRESLRDVPQQGGFPDQVEWPAAPDATAEQT
jgi:hypothetical protein